MKNITTYCKEYNVHEFEDRLRYFYLEDTTRVSDQSHGNNVSIKQS